MASYLEISARLIAFSARDEVKDLADGESQRVFSGWDV
jgi:hypothetical protein